MTHKGFFEHKLANPAVYDQGKEKAKQDRLKMPNFNFSKPEIDAVTTLLDGLGGRQRPGALFLQSGRPAADIIEGWWVVRKYNCMGCHQVHVGQTTIFDDPAALPGSRLDGPAAAHSDRRRRARQSRMADALPEQSVADRHAGGDGSRRRAPLPARAHADFLFLAMERSRRSCGSSRRMSSQAAPYIADRLDPLTDQERTMARAVVLQRRRALPEVPCHRRPQT